MRDVKIDLEADTAKARAQIDEAARDKKATVEVDADTAKAEAQIDVAARDRKATIELDVDKDRLASIAGDFERIGASGLTNAATGLEGIGTAARGASSSMGGLSSSMGGLGSGAAGIAGVTVLVGALGEALLGLAGIAAAASGALLAVPAAVAGIGAAAGTLVVGLQGITDAYTAVSGASKSAGADATAHASAVTSATRSLTSAVQAEKTAQQDVTRARKDAARQLEDLNDKLRDGAINEAQAKLDLQKAQERLATGTFETSSDYQQAQLDVIAASQRVNESHKDNARAQQEANDTRARGVEGDEKVIAAEDRLAAAAQAAADAQRQLNDANDKTSSSAQKAAEAMAQLSPNAQQFVNALIALKPVYDEFRNSIQDALFANLGPQLTAAVNAMLPAVQPGLTRVAAMFNSMFGQVTTLFQDPKFLAAVSSIIDNIATAFGNLAPMMTPLVQAFTEITQVGSGFMPQLAQFATDAADAFGNFITEASQTGNMRQWMSDGLTVLYELGQAAWAIVQAFLQLAPVGKEIMPQIVGLCRDLRDLMPLIIGQAGLMKPVLEYWRAELIGIKAIVDSLRPAFTVLKGVIETLGPTLVKALVSPLEAIITIFNKIPSALRGGIPDLPLPSQLLSMGGIISNVLGAGATTPSITGTPTPGGWGGAPSRPGIKWVPVTPTTPTIPTTTTTTVTPGAAVTGDTPLRAALAAKGFSPKLIRLIEAFSQTEGLNPAGVPTLGFTDAQLGGRTDLQAHVDALAQQFQDRASVAGPFPENGTDQEQAQWIAKVVGQAGVGNQPADYVQRVTSAMGGLPGLSPATTTTTSTGTPVFVTNWPSSFGGVTTSVTGMVPGVGAARPSILHDTGGTGSQAAAIRAAAAVAQNFPQITDIGGSRPAGTAVAGTHEVGKAIDIMIPNYETPQGVALGNQIRDYMQANAQALNVVYTIWQNQVQNTGIGGRTAGPGGTVPGHMNHIDVQFADGTAVSMGPGAPTVPTVTPGLPGKANQPLAAGQYMPTGNPGDPLNVALDPNIPAGQRAKDKTTDKSDAEQLGKDFVSGIFEIFGFGDLFKDPTEFGLFKVFKAIMGIKVKDQGHFTAAGVQDRAAPADSGGDGSLGGLLGLVPKPAGELKVGTPANAPTEFIPNITEGGAGGSLTDWITGMIPSRQDQQKQKAGTVDNSITIQGNNFGHDPQEVGNQITEHQMQQARPQLRPLPTP